MNLLVIDIGGTEIKGALIDRESMVLEKIPTLQTQAIDGAKRVVERIIAHVEEYEFDGIGIATAGQVDIHDGSIRYANPNIPGYTGIALKQIFAERFNVAVHVENDVNAAALGELHFGAGKAGDAQDFLCITVGTGVGGAIIHEGKLHRGFYGGAGEFGHLITHADARLAGDGSDEMAGCYEVYASTTALVRNSMALDPSLTDGRKVFAKFEDLRVKAVIDAWIGELAMGLVSLIHAWGPQMILFGGGIMREPYIMETLTKLLDRHVFPSFMPVKLRQAELGSDANLWGAAVPFLKP